jgi:hypothetical protein
MATVTASYNWVSGETVTPTKLNSTAAPTVVVADNEVTTAKILDANVTNAKLASGIDASKLTTGTLPIARIADGAVGNAKLADGTVVQVVQANSGAKLFTTAVIPADNTSPLSTEGEQVLSQAITPATTANKVLARAVVPFNTASNPNVIFALFRGTTCIASTMVAPTGGSYAQIAVLEVLDAPNTNSSVTYSVRAGTNGGSNVVVSGYGDNTEYFNNTYLRSLTLTEIKAS